MSMLYAVLLKMKPDNDSLISPTQGHHAHALFLNLIQQAHSTLADELHKPSAHKPFTISPLQGKFQRAEKQLKISNSVDCWIRITFLREDLFSTFMDATFKAAGKPLRLETALFHIDRVVLTSLDSPLCGHVTYQNLLDNAQAHRKIMLRFLSPTAFRSGGKRNVLFPEPSLVFGSYFNKWQHFSPVKLNKEITGYLKSIVATKYKLTTHILHYDSYQETGFEGSCTFDVPEESSDELVKSLNTLADFAFYCGTGAKTTMGMGQTRRAIALLR